MSLKPRAPQSQLSGMYNGQVWGQTSYGQVVPTIIGRTRAQPKMIWAANHRKAGSSKKFKQAKKKGAPPAYAQNCDFLIGSTPIRGLFSFWRNRDYFPTSVLSFTGTILAAPTPPWSYDAYMPITNLPAGHTALGPIGVTIEVPLAVSLWDWGAPAALNFSGPSQLPMYRLLSMRPPVFISLPGGQFPYPYVYEWALASTPLYGPTTTPNLVFFFGSMPSLVGATVTVYYAHCATGRMPETLLHLIEEYNAYHLGSGTEYGPSWTAQRIIYDDVDGFGSESLDLGTADSIPTISMDTISQLQLSQYGEACPADVIQLLMGMGQEGLYNGGNRQYQPLLSIADQLYRSAGATAFLGDLEPFRTFCMANDIFVSLKMDTQQSGTQWIQEVLEVANCDALWSGFLLKIVPRSEVSAVGNGKVYTAPTSGGPIVDLGMRNFLARKGQPVVTVHQMTILDAPNIIPVEYLDMDNQFNATVLAWPDQGDIFERGAWTDGVHTLHEIQRTSVAQKVAAMMVQRSIHQRRTFKFTLPLGFEYLEPGDPATLTNPNVGLDHAPIRLTKVTETSDWELECEAEDYIWGVNAPTPGPTQGTSNTTVATNADPGDVQDTVIFDLPAPLCDAPGMMLGIACCSANPDWGGAAVLCSDSSGGNYILLDTIKLGNTMGRLTTLFPSHADPDAADTLSVDLSESLGSIAAATTAQRDQFASLAYVEGASGFEIVGYAAVTYVGSNIYHLTPTTRRGVYGTTPMAHAIGTRFALIDASLAKVQIPQQWIGQTLYFKFCSFNTYGGEQQDPSTVTPITYVPTGAGLPMPQYSITPQTPVSQPSGGGVNTLVVAPFTAAFPTGTVSYLGKTISITAPVAPITYWVTVGDPGQIGEGGGNPALTYYADTNNARANSPGFTFCGMIVATVAGGVTGTAGGSAGPR